MQNYTNDILTEYGKKKSSRLIKAYEKLYSLYLDLAFKNCAKTQSCVLVEEDT